LLEELNLTVYRQQQQLDQLRRELRALHQQIQNASPAESRNSREETPPHY
jgi:SlyX protein